MPRLGYESIYVGQPFAAGSSYLATPGAYRPVHSQVFLQMSGIITDALLSSTGVPMLVKFAKCSSECRGQEILQLNYGGRGKGTGCI